MKFKDSKSFCKPLLPVLLIALTSISARAEYIYDGYHSTGAADAKKLLQVRLVLDAAGNPTDEVEVRTLCKQSDAFNDCAEKTVIKKDRLEAVASLEKAQYQRLLESFKSRSETDKWVGGSLSMVGLGMAFPPAAPVALPLALMLEGMGVAQHETAKRESAKYDPRLGRMSAILVQNALTADVAASDSRKDDELEIIRANLKELFSDEVLAQLQISRNPAIALGTAKLHASDAATDMSDAVGMQSGSAR